MQERKAVTEVLPRASAQGREESGPCVPLGMRKMRPEYLDPDLSAAHALLREEPDDEGDEEDDDEGDDDGEDDDDGYSP